jgi:hypothetical protein
MSSFSTNIPKYQTFQLLLFMFVVCMMWLQVVCESVSKIALVLEQVGGGADEEGAAALRTTNGDIIAAAKHIKLDRLTRFVLIIIIIICLFISSAPENSIWCNINVYKLVHLSSHLIQSLCSVRSLVQQNFLSEA